MLTTKDRLILARWTESIKIAWHTAAPYVVLALWLALFVPALCLVGLAFLLAFPLIALAYLVCPAITYMPWGDWRGWVKRMRDKILPPQTVDNPVSKDTPPTPETPIPPGAEGVDLPPQDGRSDVDEDEEGQTRLDYPLLGVACPTALSRAELDATGLTYKGGRRLPRGIMIRLEIDVMEDVDPGLTPTVWHCHYVPAYVWIIRLDSIDTPSPDDVRIWLDRQLVDKVRQEEVERLLSLPDYRGSKGYAQLRRDVKGFCGLSSLPRGDRRCLAMMLAERKNPYLA